MGAVFGRESTAPSRSTVRITVGRADALDSPAVVDAARTLEHAARTLEHGASSPGEVTTFYREYTIPDWKLVLVGGIASTPRTGS